MNTQQYRTLDIDMKDAKRFDQELTQKWYLLREWVLLRKEGKSLDEAYRIMMDAEEKTKIP